MQTAQSNVGIFRVFKPTILFQAAPLPSLQQFLLQPELAATTAALWNQSLGPLSYASITTAPPPSVHVPQGYHELSSYAPVFHQHIPTEPREQPNLVLTIETQPEESDAGRPYASSPSDSARNTGAQCSPSKTRNKRFPCPLCDIRCSNNGQLQGHMRIHTGERPYRCNVENCDRRFARNEELTRHKRIHTGFRPHKCEICDKAFGRKDHLNKHEKTHLQDAEKKVFTCLVSGCGQRYSRSDALTRHQWTAHSILRPSRQGGRGVKLELQERPANIAASKV